MRLMNKKMSEQKIYELEAENRALRAIISQCGFVLSDLGYEWTDIAEAVGQETMKYYSQSDSDFNKDASALKTTVLDWFDEPNEFTDCLEFNCFHLDSYCKIKSLDYLVSILARVKWNNQSIHFHYCGDDSFSNFGVIELNDKRFEKLCPEYYVEMKFVMNSLSVAHNDDLDIIYRFHVLLAQLALYNNDSEYDITAGDCYTFTYQFQPSKLNKYFASR